VNLNIDASYFEKFVVTEPCIVGVNVKNVNKVLSCISSPCSLYQSENGDKLCFGSDNSCFELSTIEIDSEEMNIPDIDFDVEMTTSSTAFFKTIKDLGYFGDTIRFTSKLDRIVMSSSGEIGTASFDVYGSETDLTIRGTLLAEFTVRYLTTFGKSGLSKNVVVKIANDMPMLIDFKFGDNAGVLRFFLAPKVIEED
jgi:proliferating cell nuclear antigen